MDFEARYREALLAGADEAGVELDDALAQIMSVHYGFVVKWAAKMNLTSVIDPIEAANLHGLDSLLFIPLLPRGVQVTDVGSGAGFPGIVVALARPDLKMTLLEPRRKRASFLRVALSELKRDDITVIEGRLEEAEAYKTGAALAFPADVVLSRATIPPVELVKRAAAKLNPGGRIISTQGGPGAQKAPELRAAAESVGLVHFARYERILPGAVVRVLDVFTRTTPKAG